MKKIIIKQKYMYNYVLIQRLSFLSFSTRSLTCTLFVLLFILVDNSGLFAQNTNKDSALVMVLLPYAKKANGDILIRLEKRSFHVSGIAQNLFLRAWQQLKMSILQVGL